MPKQTFFNLSNIKREKIISALDQEFQKHTLEQATVKDVVELVGLSRGSFYQYFDSLEESYFYILLRRFHNIHLNFLKFCKLGHVDLQAAMYDYGDFLAAELYSANNYDLFRNRYLYWSLQLEMRWREYMGKQNPEQQLMLIYTNERLQFIGAVFHSLIQRLYLEGWSRDIFLKHYNETVHFILNGIDRI